MDYAELNSLRYQHMKAHGEAATNALIERAGGRDADGISLAAVPLANYESLAAEFREGGAQAKARPKTFGELYAPAFRKFNAGKRSRANE